MWAWFNWRGETEVAEMNFRVPLGPKNSVDGSKGTGKRKGRTLVPPTIEKSSLAEALRIINTYASPCAQIMRITEEDLAKPSVSDCRKLNHVMF